MAKWTDKHIYPWMEWMRSLYATHTKINEWTVTPTSPFKFAIFTLNIIVGLPLLGLLIGLMAIPQTFEWIMANITDEVEDIKTGTGIKSTIKDFILIILTFIVVIPYAVTYCLPNIIKVYKVERKIKKTIEVEDYTRVDWGRHADPVGEVEILWPYAPAKRDFTPKRELKAHTMIEPRFINTGNSITIGSTHTARGNFTLYGQAGIRIVDRGDVTLTAMVTDNMT